MSEKKTRTPKNAEAITKGAMKLDLKDMVKLRNELSAQIDYQVKQSAAKAAEDAKIANGLLADLQPK